MINGFDITRYFGNQTETAFFPSFLVTKIGDENMVSRNSCSRNAVQEDPHAYPKP
jgi:hypothetical protein